MDNLWLLLYRPGQPNWEYTNWKCKDISASQILREINVSHFEAPKTAILTILATSDLEFSGIFDISIVRFLLESKFKAS